MKLPSKVNVIEVLPRDGLQNENIIIKTDDKVELINNLANAGFSRIEATSFVHPKWVPQLKDADEVIKRIIKKDSLRYSALVPNEVGLERSIASGIQEITLFVSASPTHNYKNINSTIQDTMNNFKKIADKARKNGIFVRGAIAMSFGSPFDEIISYNTVLEISKMYKEMNVYEIVLSDTVGVANPKQVYSVFKKIQSEIRHFDFAAHFHNNRGLGLANVLAAMEAGISNFDSSVGGFGGCPFAPGTVGNIATEDLVNMLTEMGIETNINLASLLPIINTLKTLLQKEPNGYLHKVVNVNDLPLKRTFTD